MTYPGRVLEAIGSVMMAFGVLGIFATLFAILEIAAFTVVFLLTGSITALLCVLGYVLLSIGNKKHIKWCKDMGYIK